MVFQFGKGAISLKIEVMIKNGEPYAYDLAELLEELWDNRMDWVLPLYEGLKTGGPISSGSFDATLEGENKIKMTLKQSGVLNDLKQIFQPILATIVCDSRGYINDPREQGFEGSVEEFLRTRYSGIYTYLFSDETKADLDLDIPEYDPYYVVHQLN